MKRKSIMNKAAILLIVATMLTSMIPATLANTYSDEVLPLSEGDEYTKLYSDDYVEPTGRPCIKMMGQPMNKPDNGFSGTTDTDTLGPVSFIQNGNDYAWSAIPIFNNVLTGFDNFWGMTNKAYIETVSFEGLSMKPDPNWVDSDPDGFEFDVRFYSQSPNDHSMPPDNLVAQFVIGPDDYEREVLPGTYNNCPGYRWTLNLSTDVNIGDGWIGISEVANLPSYCLWLNSYEGDGFSYWKGGDPPDLVHDLAYTLSGERRFVCEQGVCNFGVDDVNNIEYGSTINSIPKTINISVCNKGDIPITDAKMLIDIYKKACGETNIIFDDDMESYIKATQSNNVNWTPIDNGDGDTWTLLCSAESHSPAQSYRCTRGKWRDPCGEADNVYLGHAASSSPDMLQMDNALDLDGIACATLSFWHKCTGEYYLDDWDYVVPMDYGTLQYSLDNGSTWITLPEFIAYDNPWQEITIKFIDPVVDDSTCPQCDDSDADYTIEAILSGVELLVRFVWQTDPGQQYEGWYIDDVQVQTTDAPNLSDHPVWQGHKIVSLPGCVYGENIVFPVGFSGEKGTAYQMDILVQVFDCDDSDLSDNSFSIQFTVDDLHDMTTTDISGPSMSNKGDNAVYDVTVKNIGSYAESDVPVVLKLSKPELIPSSSIDDDFESSPSDWRLSYFVSNDIQPKSLWHWSADDSYSGTHCMACYNEANMLEPNLGCLLLPDMTFDLRDDDILSSTLSFNIKWSFSDDGDWEDMFGIGYSHPDGNSVVTFAYSQYMGTYDNTWRGPQNPGSWPPQMFEWDIKDDLEYLCSVYPDDFPDARTGIYFVVRANGDTNILNEDNPEHWSGVKLDDVKIKTVRLSSTSFMTVDTTTTDVLNPGDSQTLSMNWNDTQYCNWIVSGETQLAGDVNASNDDAYTKTKVTDMSTDFSFESVDLTKYSSDSMWHIVDKQTFGPEPTTDSYWWCGKVYDTWGGYANNMDDSLITEPINLSSDGAILEFDTWHEFHEQGNPNGPDDPDYGEIYYSPDNGTTWKYIDKITGDSDWHVVQYDIPSVDCTDQFRLKFRMISDDEDVSNGWYIDDLRIIRALTFQRDIFSENFGAVRTWTFGPLEQDNGWTVKRTQKAGGVSPEAYLDCRYTSDTWVEIGPFDTSGYATLDLSALTYLYKRADSGYALEVHTDDGSGTWAHIPYSKTIDATVPTGRQDIAVTLTTADGIGSPNFGIRLFFKGNPQEIRHWSIDNITLESIAHENFSPDWIETRDWTLIQHNTDFNNYYRTQDKYYPTTWALYILNTDDCALIRSDTCSHPGICEHDEHMQSPVLSYTLAPDEYLYMKFDSSTYSSNPNCPDQHLIEVYNGTSWNVIADILLMDTDTCVSISLPSDTQQVNFHRVSPEGGSGSWHIDNLKIGICVLLSPYLFDFEEGEAHYRANGWETHSTCAGDFWQQDITCPFGDYDNDGLANGCINYPRHGTGLNDVLYTVIDLTEDTDIIYAEYQFAISYCIRAYSGCRAYVELSTSYDPSEDMAESTSNWRIVVENSDWSNSEGWMPFNFDLTDHIGKTVTIRFRLVTPGNNMFNPTLNDEAGYWVDGFALIYKEKPPATDELPPTTAIVFSGSTCTLLAADQAGPVVSGVAATYYTLNGGAQQTYTSPFALIEGRNTVEYWSVDNVGNTESRKTGMCTIDDSPPTLTITSPVNGFHLFGNKLFDMKSIFCLGKFTVKAEASDTSGIKMVTFDAGQGNTGYDTDGSDMYMYTYTQRHFGKLEITVTAYDNNGLSTEETINLKVFSFGSFLPIG